MNSRGRKSAVLYSQHFTNEHTPCTHHFTGWSLVTELAQKIFDDRVEVFLNALKNLSNIQDSNRVWLKSYLIHTGICLS
jgi:hypothetical protein